MLVVVLAFWQNRKQGLEVKRDIGLGVEGYDPLQSERSRLDNE